MAAGLLKSHRLATVATVATLGRELFPRALVTKSEADSPFRLWELYPKDGIDA